MLVIVCNMAVACTPTAVYIYALKRAEAEKTPLEALAVGEKEFGSKF